MDTSIKCNDDVKSDYNSWTGIRDITYNEQLIDALRVFESNIPFRDFNDFKQFFKENPQRFGFHKIVESDPDNEDADFVVEEVTGDKKTVALALMAKDITRNGVHDADVDVFCTAFSKVDEIEGKRVVSYNQFSHVWGEFDRKLGIRSEVSVVSSPIPSDLKDDLNTEIAKASGRISSRLDRRVMISALLSYGLDELGRESEEIMDKIEEFERKWSDLEE